eukprot:8476327-Alexandrium_andersonii.AAC.1
MACSAEHYQMRVGEMSWQKAKNDIDDRYPGESQRVSRNRLIEATCAIAETIVRGVLASSPEQRAKYEEAFEHWEDEWRQKAADPT